MLRQNLFFAFVILLCIIFLFPPATVRASLAKSITSPVDAKKYGKAAAQALFNKIPSPFKLSIPSSDRLAAFVVFSFFQYYANASPERSSATDLPFSVGFMMETLLLQCKIIAKQNLVQLIELANLNAFYQPKVKRKPSTESRIGNDYSIMALFVTLASQLSLFNYSFIPPDKWQSAIRNNDICFYFKCGCKLNLKIALSSSNQLEFQFSSPTQDAPAKLSNPHLFVGSSSCISRFYFFVEQVVKHDEMTEYMNIVENVITEELGALYDLFRESKIALQQASCLSKDSIKETTIIDKPGSSLAPKVVPTFEINADPGFTSTAGASFIHKVESSSATQAGSSSISNANLRPAAKVMPTFATKADFAFTPKADLAFTPKADPAFTSKADPRSTPIVAPSFALYAPMPSIKKIANQGGNIKLTSMLESTPVPSNVENIIINDRGFSALRNYLGETSKPHSKKLCNNGVDWLVAIKKVFAAYIESRLSLNSNYFLQSNSFVVEDVLSAFFPVAKPVNGVESSFSTIIYNSLPQQMLSEFLKFDEEYAVFRIRDISNWHKLKLPNYCHVISYFTMLKVFYGRNMIKSYSSGKSEQNNIRVIVLEVTCGCRLHAEFLFQNRLMIIKKIEGLESSSENTSSCLVSASNSNIAKPNCILALLHGFERLSDSYLQNNLKALNFDLSFLLCAVFLQVFKFKVNSSIMNSTPSTMNSKPALAIAMFLASIGNVTSKQEFVENIDNGLFWGKIFKPSSLFSANKASIYNCLFMDSYNYILKLYAMLQLHPSFGEYFTPAKWEFLNFIKPPLEYEKSTVIHPFVFFFAAENFANHWKIVLLPSKSYFHVNFRFSADCGCSVYGNTGYTKNNINDKNPSDIFLSITPSKSKEIKFDNDIHKNRITECPMYWFAVGDFITNSQLTFKTICTSRMKIIMLVRNVIAYFLNSDSFSDLAAESKKFADWFDFSNRSAGPENICLPELKIITAAFIRGKGDSSIVSQISSFVADLREPTEYLIEGNINEIKRICNAENKNLLELQPNYCMDFVSCMKALIVDPTDEGYETVSEFYDSRLTDASESLKLNVSVQDPVSENDKVQKMENNEISPHENSTENSKRTWSQSMLNAEVGPVSNVTRESNSDQISGTKDYDLKAASYSGYDEEKLHNLLAKHFKPDDFNCANMMNEAT